MEWRNRMLMENQFYNCKSVFLTLTYAPQFLPTGRTLVKKHLQDFFKRLRARLRYYNGYYGTFNDDNYISHFSCGEYGSRRKRPHYHSIIFGLICNKELLKLIRDCWKFGFVKLKPTIKRRFGYVAKYCVKETATVLNGVPEFVIMSRKNAIGKRFLKQNEENVYQNQGKIKIGKTIFYVPTQLIRRYLDKEYLDKRTVVYNVVAGKQYDDTQWLSFYNTILANCNRMRKCDFDEFFYGVYKNVRIHFVQPKEFLNLLDRNEQKEKEMCFMSKNNLKYGEYYENIKNMYIKKNLLKNRLAKYNRYIQKYHCYFDKSFTLKYFIDTPLKYLYSKRLKTLFYPYYPITENLCYREFYDKFKDADLLKVGNFFFWKTYEYI